MKKSHLILSLGLLANTSFAQFPVLYAQTQPATLPATSAPATSASTLSASVMPSRQLVPLTVKDLETLAVSGNTFEAYGIRMILPANPKNPKADASGAVVIPKVELDVSEIGFATKLTFENATLKILKEKPEFMTLEFDSIPFVPLEEGEDQFSLHKVRVILSPQNSWVSVEADSFVAQEAKGFNKGTRIEVKKPRLEIGTPQSFWQDHFLLAIDSAELTPPANVDPSEGVKMKEFRFQSDSQIIEEDQKIVQSIHFGGLQAKHSEGVGAFSITPFDFKSETLANGLPSKEGVQTFKNFVLALKMTFEDPEPNLEKALVALESLLTQFSIKNQRYQIQWGGLEYEYKSYFGPSKFIVGPLQVDAKLDQTPAGLKSSHTGTLANISLNDGFVNLSTDHLKWDDTGLSALNSKDYNRLILANLKNDLLLLLLGGGDPDDSPNEFFRSFVYLLPFEEDQIAGNIGFEKFQVILGKNEASNFSLSNALFGIKADELGLTLSAKGDFKLNVPIKPQQNIDKGTIDMTSTVRLPWKQTVAVLRQRLLSGKPVKLEDLPQLLSGGVSGLETKGRLDLGPNYWVLSLDGQWLADLSGLKISAMPTKNYRAIDLWFENLSAQFGKAFILQPQAFKASAKIKGASKFLDEMMDISKEGQTALLPYGLDATTDTLDTSLEFKDGKLSINGRADTKANAALEMLKQEIEQGLKKDPTRLPDSLPEDEDFYK